MDRPTKDLFALLDEIEEVLGITAVPAVWPIGKYILIFKGVYNRKKNRSTYFKNSGGACQVPVQLSGINDSSLESQIDSDILKIPRRN